MDDEHIAEAVRAIERAVANHSSRIALLKQELNTVRVKLIEMRNEESRLVRIKSDESMRLQEACSSLISLHPHADLPEKHMCKSMEGKIKGALRTMNESQLGQT